MLARHFEDLEIWKEARRLTKEIYHLTSGPKWSDPLSLDRFGGEFRMPSGEKKGVVDERAEEVFGGIQA
jgi:hypothetical protein